MKQNIHDSVCESREVDGFKIKTMVTFVCRDCKWSSEERVLAWKLLFPIRTSTGQLQVEAINTEFSFMPWTPLLASSGRITPTLSVHASTIFSESQVELNENKAQEQNYFTAIPPVFSWVKDKAYL